MSAFWKHYASVSDDVRHKLVEEGWFGRQVTGNINEQDMPGMVPEAPPPERHPLYEQVWGKAPEIAEIYGETLTSGAPTPTIEPSTTQEQESGPEPEV